MNTLDLSPLLRTTVGFDRINRALGSWGHDAPSYPPYNIEKAGNDNYRVTMAVAGFDEKDIEIAFEDSTLTVRGDRAKEAQDKNGEFLHRGIATRAFERRFRVDDYIRVSGAELANGLLHVNLVREVPEEKKPQRITIAAS